MKNKIVIDTNVIVAAMRSRNGASNKLMTLVGTGKFIPCISIALVLEYEDVLSRKIHNLIKNHIKEFLDYICLESEHTKIHFLWRPTLKGPSDDMLLELAIAANARYIVTYNVADFKAANKFNVEIITPVNFLKRIGEIS